MRNTVEVIILQHPLEKNRAKGSARLLHLSLENSHLIVGDVFVEKYLNDILFGDGKKPILLYPVKDDIVKNESIFFDEISTLENMRLVILDGTWRESRYMLSSNKPLQNLSKLALKAMPNSNYRIRSAHKEDQLSSLEACAYALMQIEGDSEKYSQLFYAFDLFVEMQIQLGSLNLLRSNNACQI